MTAHVFPSEEVSEGDLWRLYREHYAAVGMIFGFAYVNR